MGSSLDGINIAASTQRLRVDNRISLQYYNRIADNILRQADIFRQEKNVIDLYVMLLRFSSLVFETIPSHRDYRLFSRRDKEYLKKKLLDVLGELEKLKPVVRQRLDELRSKHTRQATLQGHVHGNDSWGLSSVRNPPSRDYTITKAAKPMGSELLYQGSRGHKFTHSMSLDDRFQKMSVNFIRPTEETLSKHSILGPNGLHGQWQLPKIDKRVQYPNDIDLTPVEIPSVHQYVENGLTTKIDNCNSELEIAALESSLTLKATAPRNHTEELSSMISFEEPKITVPDIIRQPSPPPVLAEIQDLLPSVSPEVNGAESGIGKPSADSYAPSESPLQLHISTTMMETFLKLAKSNTTKNLETCGVLAGSLKNRKFYITALIIPKQESTSDTCQATNEEEIFEVQDKQSLFPLGWIHTHPTQSCFMSSVDLHTHYSYQIMLPESVAIVMAPSDTSKRHGIFRLTSPGGISVIRQCQQRGFHSHNQPPDGGPIYKTCTDVYMNPSLKFDVIDLR